MMSHYSSSATSDVTRGFTIEPLLPIGHVGAPPPSALLPAGDDILKPESAVLQNSTPPLLALDESALEGTVVVTDPMSRKLQIPLKAIRTTLATSRPGVPSLCLLYLDGRCRQGAQCHQVHADPALVMALRAQAKQLPTCCLNHGDVNADRVMLDWRDRSLSFEGKLVPVSSMAFSLALDRLLSEVDTPVVKAHVHQICRLHGSDRCRFSEDCRFLHICRQIMREHFSAIVPDLVPQLELRHTAGATVRSVPRAQPYGARHTSQPQFVVMPDGTLGQVVPVGSAQPHAAPQLVYATAAPQGFALAPAPQFQQHQHQLGGLPMLLPNTAQQAPPTVYMVGPDGQLQAVDPQQHNTMPIFGMHHAMSHQGLSQNGQMPQHMQGQPQYFPGLVAATAAATNGLNQFSLPAQYQAHGLGYAQ
jgi:hypothetical protein